jgi:hypothetical protein
MSAIGWIRITSDGTGALDRMQVPGGWLYLSLSEDRRERALTFVPAVDAPGTAEVTVTGDAAAAALGRLWAEGFDVPRAVVVDAIEAADRARRLRP